LLLQPPRSFIDAVAIAAGRAVTVRVGESAGVGGIHGVCGTGEVASGGTGLGRTVAGQGGSGAGRGRSGAGRGGAGRGLGLYYYGDDHGAAAVVVADPLAYYAAG
jgi:hypothetical protein